MGNERGNGLTLLNKDQSSILKVPSTSCLYITWGTIELHSILIKCISVAFIYKKELQGVRHCTSRIELELWGWSSKHIWCLWFRFVSFEILWRLFLLQLSMKVWTKEILKSCLANHFLKFRRFINFLLDSWSYNP